ncbi:hypothetical protein IV203_000063 [Nitzschia inconspicua]|uniref:Uncharacterized protein n=1 Tax=Nitzschia inconspicua TaxID=303405 RepID=A0A9K3PPY9_9STRA|nr:hypothetical protein IV203_000063 [Nitzschia inconspicua]
MLANPGRKPKEYAREIETHFQSSPLFQNRAVRDIIQKQVISYVSRNKDTIHGNDFLPRIEYYGDIRSFSDKHVICYKGLTDMKRSGILPFGPEEFDEHVLQHLSALMHHYGAITPENTLPHGDNPMWRRLFCLKESSITDHPKYKQLRNSPKHTTGPDPFNRTVVFTSLALLCNMLSCKEIDFECCASADGTHGVSTTDYRLIPFGVFFCNNKGHRQFHPIAYAFGEGEREIVILILLLNVKRIAADLFGITNLQFKGGIVSDHSAPFVNRRSI